MEKKQIQNLSPQLSLGTNTFWLMFSNFSFEACQGGQRKFQPLVLADLLFIYKVCFLQEVPEVSHTLSPLILLFPWGEALHLCLPATASFSALYRVSLQSSALRGQTLWQPQKFSTDVANKVNSFTRQHLLLVSCASDTALGTRDTAERNTD